MNLSSFNGELIIPNILFLISIIVSVWLVQKRTAKMNNELSKKQRKYDYASENRELYNKNIRNNK